MWIFEGFREVSGFMGFGFRVQDLGGLGFRVEVLQVSGIFGLLGCRVWGFKV